MLQLRSEKSLLLSRLQGRQKREARNNVADRRLNVKRTARFARRATTSLFIDFFLC